MQLSFVKYIRNENAIKVLCQRIKKLRVAQKISQRQLGFEAGIPETQIRRIEKGQANTGISTIAAIANVLDVSLKELFDF